MAIGKASSFDLLLLLLLSAIWGSSFVLIKIAVVQIPPLTLAAARLVIASLILLAPLLRTAPPGLPGRFIAGCLLVGLFGNAAPFTLIGWSERDISSSLAAILIGLMPLFAMLFVHFLSRDERFTRRRFAALILGLAGLLLLSGDAPLSGAPAAAAAMLAAAACYGLAAALLRPWMARYGMIAMLAGSTIAAALMTLPAALAADQAWLAVAADQLRYQPAAAAVVLAVLNTAIGGLLFFRLIQSAGVVFASISNYLIPLFGIALGVAALGEQPSWRAFLALAFILAAVAAVRAAPQPDRPLTQKASARRRKAQPSLPQ